MKTYIKTTEEDRLFITRCTDENDNPRNDTNVGLMIVVGRSFISPDCEGDWQQELLEETSHRAKSTEHHMKLIKEEYGEKIVWIKPINRYEHGEVEYNLGVKYGFDISNCGFYIVTQKTLNEVGVELTDIKRVVEAEIKMYNAYVNGDMFHFELLDENGEFEDSCGGFFEVDDIKEHLPKGWENEDMQNYIV